MAEVSTIKYIDILNDMPELIMGIPDIEIVKKFEFFSVRTTNEFAKENGLIDKTAVKDFEKYKNSTSGCAVHFATEPGKVIISATIKYSHSLLKVTHMAASGFDVYKIFRGVYYHQSVFCSPNSNVCTFEFISQKDCEYIIYLPLYDCIDELKIGTETGIITRVPYGINRFRPIAFYGNSITQGASASRAGNAFCNIVSRKLNTEVVNYSVSSYCKANLSVAQTIGKFNYGAIVIDYSRNAFSDHSFKMTYDKFYRELRKYHPEIPIVLLTPINLSKQLGLYRFDEIIKATYNSALERNEKTIFIDVNSLFNENDADFVTVDTCHLSDYGMYILGNKIAEELKMYLK